MSESLVGDWKSVGVLETAGNDHDQVDNSPNTTATEGDEFENSSSNLSGVKWSAPIAPRKIVRSRSTVQSLSDVIAACSMPCACITPAQHLVL